MMWFPYTFSLWRHESSSKKRVRSRLTVEVLEDRAVPAFLTTMVGSSDASSVAEADFNNDSIADLVEYNTNHDTVSVRLGNGDGSFGSPQDANAGDAPREGAIGDFNNDGYLDLMVANIENLTLLLGKGDGAFQNPKTIRLGNANRFPGVQAVGDLNNDGNLDMLVTGSTKPQKVKNPFGPGFIYLSGGAEHVLLGRGDGSFSAANSTLPPGGMLALADFNNDGRLDLLRATDTVDLYPGNGDGTFQPSAFAANGLSGGGVFGEDFNGDGNLDFITNGQTYLGNGAGSFDVVSAGIPANRFSLVAEDFNGDGMLDLLEVSERDLIYLGNGDGTFGTAVVSSGDLVADAVADFNGDGLLDLASVVEGVLRVQLNDGNW